MPDRIVLAGSLAQRPGHGGHAWVFLQYLLGFRRLGWEVLFLDRLEPEMYRQGDGGAPSAESSPQLHYLTRTMQEFGLEDSFAVICDGGQRFVGRSRQQVREQVQSAPFLLNVMGFLDDDEILASAQRRVFLDIDPGFGQMWQDLGLHQTFRGHDLFVSIGENIGQPDCAIPTCGIDWITTPQPVVLDHWPAADSPPRAPLTSIASWRGPFSPIEYNGIKYGLRVHEFRKLVALPRLTGMNFELALDIHPADSKDIDLLETNGWKLVDPRAVTGDTRSYREYIQGSRAEFMVAKSLYVQSNSGWFSDRSICYLASGRPVVAQDTGFSRRYPTGSGLFAFDSVEGAAAAIGELCRDEARHGRTAREIAETYFDSDKVLSRLLDVLSTATAQSSRNSSP